MEYYTEKVYPLPDGCYLVNPRFEKQIDGYHLLCIITTPNCINFDINFLISSQEHLTDRDYDLLKNLKAISENKKELSLFSFSFQSLEIRAKDQSYSKIFPNLEDLRGV